VSGGDGEGVQNTRAGRESREGAAVDNGCGWETKALAIDADVRCRRSGVGLEVELDAVGRPGGDAGAEEVVVLGPDRALEDERGREDRPVVGVTLLDAS
jgi:hypothetical protein